MFDGWYGLLCRQDVYGDGDGCGDAQARGEIELSRNGANGDFDHGWRCATGRGDC